MQQANFLNAPSQRRDIAKVMAVPITVAWRNLADLESLLVRTLECGLPDRIERSGAV